MMQEELEFQISQFVDDALSPADRAALELRLANDAEARALLSEYRQLNARLTCAMPTSAIKWERLAEHLSAVVAEAEEAASPAIAGRIGVSTSTWRSRLAIAASIVITLSAGLLIYDSHKVSPTPGGGKITGGGETGSALVVGPQAESPAGPAVQQITIGPSPALAAQGDTWRYAEGVITSPSTATIAGAMKSSSEPHTPLR